MNPYKKVYVYPSVYSLWDKYIKIHCLLNNIKLRNQEFLVLTYFCIQGIKDETYQFILDNKLVKDKQIIDNAKSSLVSKKLIVKTASKKWEVIEPFNSLKIQNNELIFMIKCLVKNA
jgi:hypothetical protein